MARIRFDVTSFVGPYNEALAAGLKRDEIAALLGMTYTQLIYRLRALAKRGVTLPLPPHANIGRKGPPCPWKGGKAPARRRSARRASKTMSVPAPQTAVVVEPVPFCFVITVGTEV